MAENLETKVADDDLTIDGIKGFGKRVLRYFQDFIETDFRRQQAPRRRVILKNDAGFRTGIPLRKYSSLIEATWKASREPLNYASQKVATPLRFR